MKRCIASISVNGALRTKLRAISDAGFEYVEIFESDLLGSPEPAAVIGAMMRDLGITCVAFQPFRDFEGMPTAARARVFDRAERKFDVLAELGTDLMLVSSNVSPESLPDRARMVDDFRELGARASTRGLRVAFEALPWARHVRDHRDAWEVVRQVNHPAVGLALDAFSALAPGIPIDSLHTIDRDKIFHVQLADAPRLTMDAQSWSRHFRCMPGQGDLPLV
jgi:sugar phosphate isomerase/epimerase